MMARTAALKPTDSGNASARLRATSPHFSLRFFRNWPNAHRDLCNLHEAVARRAVTGLHGKPPRDRAEIRGKDVDIGVGRNIARGDSLAYSRSERLFRNRAVLDHHFAHGGKAWRNMRTLQRNHAASRKVRPCEFRRRCFKKTGECASRAELVVVQDAHEPARRRLEVGIGGFLVDLLLASEGIVETRRAYAHGGDKVVKRRSFVAALPEQLHRFPQGGSPIESSRPAAPAFALFVDSRCHGSNRT